MKWLQKLSHEIWILLMFGLVIYPRSSAQDCEEFSISIEKGPEEMLKIIKDLQSKEENEKKKCIVDKEWTVFQRRVKGDVSFNRGWDEYVKGFGNCTGDYWLGLEQLHEMTKEGNMELQINMIPKHKGTHRVVKYSDFRVGPGSDFYRLHVSGYSGNATDDSLAFHNNQQFSTKDADHDESPAWNCASSREGGWWYRITCGPVNLNGDYNKSDWKGIRWYPSYMRYSEMKFRRRL